MFEIIASDIPRVNRPVNQSCPINYTSLESNKKFSCRDRKTYGLVSAKDWKNYEGENCGAAHFNEIKSVGKFHGERISMKSFS